MSGHAEVAKLLVASGANINAQNAKGKTAFHMAINNGDVKLLGWLLENGLIPDLTESVGLSIIDHLKADSDLDTWFQIHRTSEK
uniref:Uncharacterized protein n=1 Tax=Arcella intermedia TaxID=1963864 RepID=A0A6B2LPX1_9EUKA